GSGGPVASLDARLSKVLVTLWLPGTPPPVTVVVPAGATVEGVAARFATAKAGPAVRTPARRAAEMLVSTSSPRIRAPCGRILFLPKQVVRRPRSGTPDCGRDPTRTATEMRISTLTRPERDRRRSHP